uniref:RNA-directed RNA polymerase catalytic subunit n=1 Tax=Chum salmon influenza-like virus TaxID=2777032 RepID=A0A866VZK6_9ORTO|nr:polymerase basic 1 [Chum salmon influenza-like virus]
MNINPYFLFLDIPVQAGISTTFPYTGVPPYSHGTGTGYTLDTIIRTVEYSSGEREYTSEVLGCEMVDAVNGKLPRDNEPSGKSQMDCVLEALDLMDAKHPGLFETAAQRARESLESSTVDILTQGRQTFDWTVNKNQPAATALNTTIESFKLNDLKGAAKGPLVDFCKDVLESFEKEEMEFWGIAIKKIKSKIGKKTVVKRIPMKAKMKMPRSLYMKRALSLNTMTKDAERGKLKRRAIATPGMQIRGFVLVVENMARNICEQLEQSGLPVGGNEKKAKLSNAVSKILSNCPPGGVSMTLTGDNTKWNECLSPRIFLVMVERIAKNSPAWFRDFLSIAPTMFSNKQAKLGRGFMMTNKMRKQKGTVMANELYEVPMAKYNEETRKKLEKVRKYYNKDDGSASLSPGMMMGMFNMLSTVLGVAVLGLGNVRRGCKYEWDGLQSSDDFALFINGQTEDDCLIGVNDFYRVCKLFGINMSKKKSYMNRTGSFEFTSMFYRDEFVANFAMELPSFGVAGINETADMAIGMTIIKNNMINNGMGPATAQTAIQLFISDYRFTYRCHRGDSQVKGKRMKLIKELWDQTTERAGLLVSDGGPNLYNLTTLHIPEIVLKWDMMNTDYRGRLVNPGNPFVYHSDVSGISEAMISPAHGPVKRVSYDSVSGSHSWTLRRNRSILNTDNKNMILEEQCYAKCCSIFEACFMSSCYRKPTGRQMMFDAMEVRLRLDARLDLGAGRMTEVEYREAISLLNEMA